MKFSYSNVSTFSSCPYKWKLHYKDKLRTLPETNAENALYLGLAIHKGIEEGSVEAALEEYKSHYNMLTDENYNYMIQIEHQIPKVLEILPPGGEHELKIDTDEYIGFVDYVCGDTLFDFKFSNNIENYVKSPQLSIYKYYLEQVRPDIKINHLKYIFVPKVNIRQKMKAKPPETLQEFRGRLREQLEATEVKVVEVEYNQEAVDSFRECCGFLTTNTDFPKNPTKLCDWCNFQEYCESNGQVDYMIINENDKREDKEMYKKLWIYGAPFSGKTTFATASPDHYVLSTDGNAQYVTDNYKLITDEVTKNGRIEMRKYAWQVLKDEIAKLETEQKYKTIIVDLVEDTYEMARLYMYNKLGISHESDDSFRAWDKIRTEYLSTIRRLMNLPYDIVLISHEDTSKDITKKSGENITAIKPNVTDKVANKIAGMVALVGRAVVENDKYTLQVKTDEVTFGGGRLGINNVTLPLDWNEVDKLFDVKKNGGNK